MPESLEEAWEKQRRVFLAEKTLEKWLEQATIPQRKALLKKINDGWSAAQKFMGDILVKKTEEGKPSYCWITRRGKCVPGLTPPYLRLMAGFIFNKLKTTAKKRIIVRKINL